MIALTLGEIAEVTGGRLQGADPATVVTAPPVVDSRQVRDGSLFVAVVGERVDGHSYAAAAVRAGARAALTTRVVDAPCVVVADSVAALGAVAAEVVRRLHSCTVVAITGSQGKTSTKDLLSQVLATTGPTVATAGNLNNEIGVPLTLCRAGTDTRFLVCEMGARSIGNIAYLCSLARPDIAVVLNVGTAHVGEFGSRERIAQAKGELVEALGVDGTAVLNADDPAVSAMADRTRARVVRYGVAPDAEIVLADVAVGAAGTPEFDLRVGGQTRHVRLGLLGSHQANNAAAATAAALAAGLDLETVVDALAGARSLSAWRMEQRTRPDGVVVVNDAYNANPDSMASALQTVATMVRGRHGRGYAVLGEMRELGDAAATEHAAVGRLAADLGVTVVAVGAAARSTYDGAVSAGSIKARAGTGVGGRTPTDADADAAHVADTDAAVTWLDKRLRPGDAVLVKASRAAGLERVAAALLDPGSHTAWGVGPGSGGDHPGDHHLDDDRDHDRAEGTDPRC